MRMDLIMQKVMRYAETMLAMIGEGFLIERSSVHPKQRILKSNSLECQNKCWTK